MHVALNVHPYITSHPMTRAASPITPPKKRLQQTYQGAASIIIFFRLFCIRVLRDHGELAEVGVRYMFSFTPSVSASFAPPCQITIVSV